jgi:hypothetical protein
VLRTACTAMLLTTTLLLTGCSADADKPSSTRTPAASTSASTTATTGASSGPATSAASPATPPPAPPRAACYRLSTADLTRPANDASPVPCRSRHTARTIFVGRLRGAAASPAAGDAVTRQLSTTCPSRLAQFLGGSARTRDLTRFEVVWFSPTQADTEAGAAWFRCDVVAFARGDHLLALPRKDSLAKVLTRKGALDTYGLCGTAAPGARGFTRVVCGQRHSWRALDTIILSGGRAYPGTAKVRKAGESVCKARARAVATDTLRFTYGWEWPTRQQWRAGQHFGYCWAPS